MLREAADRYRAYMLRLWRAQTESGESWRASLEDARTGERQGFASVDALCAHLRELAQAGAAQEGPDEPGRDMRRGSGKPISSGRDRGS
ncbi:MAG: hypothetical protein JXA74_17035 [Anaerolineae bacterium]|nr:hypothetical protein [Anaerolineae bacterium]